MVLESESDQMSAAASTMISPVPDDAAGPKHEDVAILRYNCVKDACSIQACQLGFGFPRCLTNG